MSKFSPLSAPPFEHSIFLAHGIHVRKEESRTSSSSHTKPLWHDRLLQGGLELIEDVLVQVLVLRVSPRQATIVSWSCDSGDAPHTTLTLSLSMYLLESTGCGARLGSAPNYLLYCKNIGPKKMQSIMTSAGASRRLSWRTPFFFFFSRSGTFTCLRNIKIQQICQHE